MTQAARRRRVLIVEDEPALRLSYDRAFRPRYDLAFATNGAEAMEQLEQHRPDVAVLDMRLPDTDGIELLRRIRLSHPDLPVILTTGYSDEIAESGAGGRTVILKPYKLETLATALDQVLGKDDAS